MLTSINIYTLKQHRIARHRYDLDLPITTPTVCHHLLNLLLGLHILAVGSLDSVTIGPREVFKAAMVNNAFVFNLHSTFRKNDSQNNWL